MRKHPWETLAAILLIGFLSGCTTNGSLLSSVEQLTSFNFLQVDTERIVELSSIVAKDGCSTDTPSPARHMASSCQFTAETWDFLLQLENWTASFEVSVSNPMTYAVGDLDSQRGMEMLPASDTICGTGLLTAARGTPGMPSLWEHPWGTELIMDILSHPVMYPLFLVL